MKKQFLFLASCALILASCGSNEKNEGQSQAQIDSAVNAKVAAHDAENAAKNDSALKAMEKEKADAMAKEAEAKAAAEKSSKGGKKHSTGGKKEETAPPPPPPPPAPTVGNGKPKMNTPDNGAAKQDNGTIGNGKPKMK